MASALPLLACMTLTACQWGSGNVYTGNIHVQKLFVGCPDGSSGVAAASQGDTAGETGGDNNPPAISAQANAQAVFAGTMGVNDVCRTPPDDGP